MMRDIVTALISPLGTAMLLWALSLLLLVRDRQAHKLWLSPSKPQRRARVVGTAGLVWLLLWSLPLVSDLLTGAIENQAGPREIAALPVQSVAVVLGGGVSGPRPPQRPDPDLNASADRLWHAARLYHAGKARALLLSGGTVRTGDGSEAEAMRRFLLDLGVPDSAIWLEGASTNTASNAEHTTQLLRERHITSALLVTSALHMPRARAAFERLGFKVYPAATDFEVIPMPMALHRVLPNANALLGSSKAFKEVLGRWIAQ
ncbi:MAG: YdcF family protein [Limnohabitans sp.]